MSMKTVPHLRDASQVQFEEIPGLAPGLYVLDVPRALEQLLGGRSLGRCKACGFELRLPPNVREWPTCARTFITHPLLHDRSEETRRSVEAALAVIDDLLPEWAERTLARTFEAHAPELIRRGLVARVQGGG
jgi:hypothetical protein